MWTLANNTGAWQWAGSAWAPLTTAPVTLVLAGSLTSVTAARGATAAFALPAGAAGFPGGTLTASALAGGPQVVLPAGGGVTTWPPAGGPAVLTVTVDASGSVTVDGTGPAAPVPAPSPLPAPPASALVLTAVNYFAAASGFVFVVATSQAAARTRTTADLLASPTVALLPGASQALGLPNSPLLSVLAMVAVPGDTVLTVTTPACPAWRLVLPAASVSTPSVAAACGGAPAAAPTASTGNALFAADGTVAGFWAYVRCGNAATLAFAPAASA